jgi:pregnancy-associated plasma protein-A
MNLRRRALSLAAIAALSLALVPTPVLATAVGACVPGGGAVDTFLGRDGTAREKDTGQPHADLPPRAKGKAPSNFSVAVPVWFHVITDGSVGNLTSQQITAQMAALNAGFGGDEGGDDTGFSFTLAGVTRTDNPVWYAARSAGAEHEMKRALKRGNDGTLNVYTNTAGSLLGWAYLPEITDTAQAYLDGIVIDWETVPGASDTYAGQFDEGDTLTHEAGHWLNLEHTFFGQCNKSGDFVDDTPAQKKPSSGCPVGNDTCRQPGSDPIHNYMDYSDDACITEFTPGQTQRMGDAWLFWRAS